MTTAKDALYMVVDKTKTPRRVMFVRGYNRATEAAIAAGLQRGVISTVCLATDEAVRKYLGLEGGLAHEAVYRLHWAASVGTTAPRPLHSLAAVAHPSGERPWISERAPAPEQPKTAGRDVGPIGADQGGTGPLEPIVFEADNICVGNVCVSTATAGTPAPFPHYFKDVRHLDKVDVYRVLALFEVTDPAIQHAVKKLLCAGGRGVKDKAVDYNEAKASIERALAMLEEDSHG